MKKKVEREVEVTVCDFCGEEKEGYVDRCGVCKRDMCSANKHAAYALEVFRYEDSARVAGIGEHICHDCAERDGIGVFLDKMLAR